MAQRELPGGRDVSWFTDMLNDEQRAEHEQAYPTKAHIEHLKRKAAYDAEYQAWKNGGEIGNPPPRPVPPHTPGP